MYLLNKSASGHKLMGPHCIFRKQRRPSSDDISTPTSNRSRSSSLLSSEYIPEELEEEITEEENQKFEKLVQLVHDLKEEDLNNHKRKLQASKAQESSSEEENLNPQILDLQKVLVPTTTQLFQTLPENPAVLELASASLGTFINLLDTF